jgi:hypothetical protein
MRELSLKFICPICGAAPQEKCELSTGAHRFEPHIERIDIAKDHLYGHSSDDVTVQAMPKISLV